MSFDPHALKIYVDGSCSKNPGGRGGFAVWVEFPFDWNRADELLDYVGYFCTNSNRMELKACIFAHEWVFKHGEGLGVQRVQIVTDSKYVFDNYNRAVAWSQNAWRNRYERPPDNKDLWKGLLSIRRKLRVRVEVEWTKGKRSEILKAVDRSAKNAAALPSQVDRGFRAGKIGRSKNNVKGAARLFPASGEEAIIRIYHTVGVRPHEHKVKFQLYSEEKKDFFDKFMAYVDAGTGTGLHRQHVYLVRMNSLPEYPQIEEILGELKESDLVEQVLV